MGMRLINADALKEEVKTLFCPDGYKIMMLQRIDNAPTVERPHGEWIISKIDGEKYNCSECGGSCWYYDYQGNVSKSNFCPNCGAEMRKGEN